MQSFNPLNASAFDCKVVASDGETVTLQMQVPSQFVDVIPALFSSLHGSFKLLSHRSKVAVAKAKAVDPVEIAKRQERARQFDAAVLVKYDAFILSGKTHREALRAVKQSLDGTLDTYSIELIIRDSGRLSKRKNKNNLIISSVQKSSKGNKAANL